MKSSTRTNVQVASGVAISTGVMGVIAYQRMPEKVDSGEEGCHARAAGTWSTPALSDAGMGITNKNGYGLNKYTFIQCICL